MSVLFHTLFGVCFALWATKYMRNRSKLIGQLQASTELIQKTSAALTMKTASMLKCVEAVDVLTKTNDVLFKVLADNPAMLLTAEERVQQALEERSNQGEQAQPIQEA